MNHELLNGERWATDETPRGRTHRVLLAGGLTAMDAPGGGEVQMLSLARALPEAGVAARLWRPWEDDLGQADCLHLFGSLREHLPLVAVARRRGLRVALSPITWFGLDCCWGEPRALGHRVASCARFLLRAACPAIPSWRRRLYHAVDLLMPNSQAEAQQLIRYFGVPPEKVRVVPNGADARFEAGDPELFPKRFGVRKFVLAPGRIEPRKNQLGLLRALRGTGVPIVILGDTVPGQEAYYQACRRVADPSVRFLGRLEHTDPLLASAYAAASCLALVSWFETPGLVALEAAMTGTPLVLPEGGCAREYFGHHAEYVRADDGAAIRASVLAAIKRRRSRELATHVGQYFSWRAAARITRRAYDQLL
jgi:glycosyltransferase involved in cell wall biosynthesis